MTQEAPEPVYFCEHVTGSLWRQEGVITLGFDAPPPDGEILLQGDIVLRYGIDLMKTPAYQLVPGYFETENGAVKVGRAAWDFMWAKFQLYPRADVIGIRSDGKPLNVWMRDLDFSESPRVLAYENEAQESAVGRIGRIVTAPDVEFPELLSHYAGLLK